MVPPTKKALIQFLRIDILGALSLAKACTPAAPELTFSFFCLT
jgi:hypothetical protein